MASSTVIKVVAPKSEVIEVYNGSSDVIYKPFYQEVLYKIPFRIRVTNITVPGYSPSNVPPIGIAIIGFNNYIL
jgi:hypothetical protein